MKLSILIITYNQEKHIKECIEGLLIQELPISYEILIADDCSTDNTIEIIKEELKYNLNYKILDSGKNLGMVKNYQRGFAACKGQYIATLEGDDYWTDPKRIVKHIDFLDNHRECSMSFNRYATLNNQSREFNSQNWDSKEPFIYFNTRNLALKNRVGNLSTCVFRKTALDKLAENIFDIWIADWMLAMAVGHHGLLVKLKDTMSVYRVNDAGQWGGKSKEEKNKLILKNIDNYNKFFNYQYNAEFTKNKNSILNTKKTIRKQKFKDALPPFLIEILKLIIPQNLR
jgi:glycosyltransferase involved in cell wall biosynthesis